MNKVFTTLLAVALLCVTVSADLITLDDNKSTSFSIELTSHVGNTWTYTVKEEHGRDLSHWNLELCEEIVTNQISTANGDGNFEKGKDGNTDYYGVKWNVEDGFSTGTFSITLKENYKEGNITVVAKAGNTYATGTVQGPICETCDDPGVRIPEPTSMTLGAIGLVAIAAFALKKRKGKK